jgi:hypothetical protein
MTAQARRTLAAAITAAIASLACGQASAQSSPYQSVDRSLYGKGIGQSPLPSGLTLQPRVDVAAQYVSNLTLAEDGEPQIDMAGLEAAPGIYAAYSSDRAIGALDYSLAARAWEDSEYNNVAQFANANGRWTAVPDWFYLQGAAAYRDAVIDPAISRNFGRLGIFGPDNITQVASASITPVLQREVGQFVFLARYSYGRVWHFDVPNEDKEVEKQDSVDQAARVSVGTQGRGRPYGVLAFYEWQHTEYESYFPYEYEQTGLEGNALIRGGVSFVGSVGLESDLEKSTTSGGLDSTFWSAGLKWVPDERTTAEARYGQRFFGDSWSMLINRRQRMFEFDASYNEDPEVRTRRQSLPEFDPGDLPTDPSGDDYIGNAGQPYVGKRATAGITAIGARTRLRLAGYRYERDYITGDLTDDVRETIAFSAKRDLAANLKGEFIASFSDYDQTQINPAPEPPTKTYYSDQEYVFRLKRDMSRDITATAEAGWLERSGSQDYDGWWVAFRLRYAP